MRQVIVRNYYTAEILYNFLSILTSSNEKNSKLENCRSRRDLQFSYKNHLYQTSYRRVMIFQSLSLIMSLPVT
jgi:hypothetical protein